MNLPSPETMLIYASILEKPQYYIHKGMKFRMPQREIMEKLAGMTPKEFSDFMHDHFQKLCSKPLGDRKPPAERG